MSAEANKATIRHHLAALDAGNHAVVSDHPLCRTREPFYQRTLAAFYDHDTTIHELVAEDDWVVARFTWSGTHQGEWMGIAATGKRVASEVIVMFQVVDGAIMQVHSLADVIGLLRQLSAPPESAGR